MTRVTASGKVAPSGSSCIVTSSVSIASSSWACAGIAQAATASAIISETPSCGRCTALLFAEAAVGR
jgi:hypothetical protein